MHEAWAAMLYTLLYESMLHAYMTWRLRGNEGDGDRGTGWWQVFQIASGIVCTFEQG